MTITFAVLGTPAPQGSKRHVGRGIMVESCKALAPWRESVIWAAREARGDVTINGPVAVAIVFYLPRPKSAPKRVTVPFRKPDLDKLCRGVLDALTIAGVIDDDALVVLLHARKLFCGGLGGMDVPGAMVTVEALTPTDLAAK